MFKKLKIKTLKHSFKIYNSCLAGRQVKFIIVLLLTTIFLLIVPEAVHGQTLSLSLWPPLLEVMMQPGRTITQVYKLTNNSDHDLKIVPRIYPFEPSGTAGQINIKFLASLPNFISFDSGEKFGQPFPLFVGQTKEMVLKISLPNENPEKDYYCTLLFSSAEETLKGKDVQDKSQTGSITQIGSNILITVSKLGKPVLSGKITEFSSPMIVDSFSPVPFNVVLENWGNTLWKPFGRIVITGIFKQREDLKLLEQNILANSSRQLAIPLFRPKIPLGPYKTLLEFTLNEDGPKLFTEITFWYLPGKALGAIAILLSVIFLAKKLKKGQKKIKNKPIPPPLTEKLKLLFN